MDKDRAAIILARIRGMLDAVDDEEMEEMEDEDEEGMQKQRKRKQGRKEGNKVSLSDRIKTIKAKM